MWLTPSSKLSQVIGNGDLILNYLICWIYTTYKSIHKARCHMSELMMNVVYRKRWSSLRLLFGFVLWSCTLYHYSWCHYHGIWCNGFKLDGVSKLHSKFHVQNFSRLSGIHVILAQICLYITFSLIFINMHVLTHMQFGVALADPIKLNIETITSTPSLIWPPRWWNPSLMTSLQLLYSE
jgi:hypothetical protein